MIRGAVKTLSAGVDRLRRIPPGVVVLIYHRVGTRADIEMDVAVDTFARQMEQIAASRAVISLGSALDAVTRDSDTRSTSIVVTFDDGTADFVDAALPVLVEHRIPATVYVATDFIERQVSFPHDGRPLTWNALQDALDTGLVTVGSHTHTHTLLDRVTPEAAAEELQRSGDLIEDRLGVRAEHFAYPKALVGPPDVETVVRRSFRSAALAGTRPNRYGDTDVHRLARSPIQRSDGPRWFEHKLRGGMALEDDLRRVLNRRRYAGARS